MATDLEMMAAVDAWLHDPLEQEQLSRPIPDIFHDEAASAALLEGMAALKDEKGEPVYRGMELQWDRYIGWQLFVVDNTGGWMSAEWDDDRKRAVLLAAYEASKQ